MSRLSAQVNKAFTPSERRSIIDALALAQEEMDRISVAYERSEGEEETRLSVELEAVHRRVMDLNCQYQTSLPVVPLSRCPFTGEVLRHSIDLFGIDGPWWNYQVPARPVEELPSTYFALAGSLKLNREPDAVPFLCKPGPEVPYVVPHLIGQPEIKAVISSIAVGPHEGFPIFYFSQPTRYEILRVNTWGLDCYVAEDPYGAGYSAQTYDVEADYDFDLEKWIRGGKLLWIAPGDRSLTLRSTTGSCPYLGLEGRCYPVCIQNGRTWSSMIR
ncbi:MAG: hypothetical protein ACE5EQ_00010 [Phycisphaerae bacterium]